jgi:hypothetical protein
MYKAWRKLHADSVFQSSFLASVDSRSARSFFAEDMVYVDLRINPERYTGYKGVSATRIWEAVYNENCFRGRLL